MTHAFGDAAIDGESNAGTSNGANPPVTTGHGHATVPAATAKPAASVAPPGYRQVHPLDLYLENEPGGGTFFEGEFINFNGQTGEWSLGRDNNKRAIGSTTPFLVNTAGMAIGHVKCVDGKIVDREIGLVADGYRRKAREELDDYPERCWPYVNGMRRDPWLRTTYLPMRNTETDELVVYGPFSPSALKAIKDFVALVRRSNRGGMDPVVLLGSRRFTNQHGGINYAPVFTIAGWESWDGQPAPALSPIAVPIAPRAASTTIAPARKSSVDCDLNDEVPF
jgi:hypothetical protein